MKIVPPKKKKKVWTLSYSANKAAFYLIAYGFLFNWSRMTEGTMNLYRPSHTSHQGRI